MPCENPSGKTSKEKLKARNQIPVVRKQKQKIFYLKGKGENNMKELNTIYEGNNGSYIINGKDLNSIKGIEALNLDEVKALSNMILGSSMEIVKGHEIYFIDFRGYFGYSALVFLNGKHLYYADDFQLHHKMIFTYTGDEVQQTPHTPETLKKYYMESMQNKLFTFEELQNAFSYDEYQRKDYYFRNYWIMQFDRLSAFVISGTEEEKHFNKSKKDYPFYNSYAFCYMKDKKIIDMQIETARKLQESYKSILSDPDRFRQAIRYELSNHEACITCDYSEALAALGLKFSKLSVDFQRIVNSELNRCIDEYLKAE